MIISFSWTTPALLAGAKTCTRRHWTPSHARKIRDGQLVDAWDRLPRVKGARKVATIRITAAPELQSTMQIPGSDWFAEGFDWLSHFGTLDDAKVAHAIWTGWRSKAQLLYVVRFELEALVDARR